MLSVEDNLQTLNKACIFTWMRFLLTKRATVAAQLRKTTVMFTCSPVTSSSSFTEFMHVPFCLLLWFSLVEKLRQGVVVSYVSYEAKNQVGMSLHLRLLQTCTHLYCSVPQHGKDFEAIQNNIAMKYKKRGKPANMVKNKEQVRHFYYRTWHKISKHIDFANGELPFVFVIPKSRFLRIEPPAVTLLPGQEDAQKFPISPHLSCLTQLLYI